MTDETSNTDTLDDFSLLDRYQSFSSEVVRLSLVLLGAFGALLTLEKGAGVDMARTLGRDPTARHLCMAGLAALLLAISVALLHRYASSDAMYYVILGRRRHLSDQETRRKQRMFKASEYAILIAPIAFGIGVISFGVAFL